MAYLVEHGPRTGEEEDTYLQGALTAVVLGESAVCQRHDLLRLVGDGLETPLQLAVLLRQRLDHVVLRVVMAGKQE